MSPLSPKEGNPSVTSLYQCFDASSQIPAEDPPGAEAVLGYLNSRPARDPWSLEDWLRFHHLRQFPAWVADLSLDGATGIAQARQAAEQAAGLGWHKGRAIVADMEAIADLAWWLAWSREIVRLGYRPVWYGSGSVAPSAQDAPLRWLAEPDGLAELPDHYQAKQYRWNVAVAGGVVDLSVMDAELFKHGGVGPRHSPGLAASLRAAARIIPHNDSATIAQTGETPVSAAETIKTFIDAHAPELEAILGDAARTAEAIDPQLAAIAPLFAELEPASRSLVADIVRQIHGSSASAPADPTSGGDTAEAGVTGSTVPGVPAAAPKVGDVPEPATA